MPEKNKLIILKAAQNDLEEIARMHMELVGPKSALKIGERIYNALERLCDHPHMGVAMPDRELNQKGYRKLICGNYLCFYRLIDHTVFIYHIVDGRTEYKQLFHSLPEDE
jgi:plasmid stabilization system protein ParE